MSLQDGLNVPEVLGKLSFRGIEGPDIIFEDRTQLVTLTALSSKSTQEIRGLWWRFILLSNMRPSFTIADMAQSEIEDLGIKYREER